MVMKYIYIKKEVPGSYIELDELLDPNSYDNIGNTYEDYLKGYFVLLNDKLIEFREENPDASVYEVWNMELTQPYRRTIEDAKNELKAKISSYDVSDNVNDFTINEVIHAWFTPAERTDHALSIQSAKNLGQEILIFAVGDNILQVQTDQAELMLSAILLYANSCYMVTKQHQVAVDKLETIEEVDAYDYTKGYPSKLNFNLI